MFCFHFLPREKNPTHVCNDQSLSGQQSACVKNFNISFFVYCQSVCFLLLPLPGTFTVLAIHTCVRRKHIQVLTRNRINCFAGFKCESLEHLLLFHGLWVCVDRRGRREWSGGGFSFDDGIPL